MKKQTLSLLLILLGFTSISSANTCQSILEVTISDRIEALEVDMKNTDLDPQEMLLRVMSLPAEVFANNSRITWLLAEIYYRKGDLQSYQISYGYLQSILKREFRYAIPENAPGFVFIEAYLHLRKKIGLNTFNDQDPTDKIFIALTSELSKDNKNLGASFDANQWGIFETHRIRQH